jgi:hypothetical protein
MFVAGLVFGHFDGRAVLASRDRLLVAKDREDVSDILGRSWLDPRFIAYLCVAVISVASIALMYDDGVLKIATASIWALIAGRCGGTLPSLVALKKYARSQNAQPAA